MMLTDRKDLSEVERCARVWAAIQLQAVVRGRRARADVVREIQQHGTLLAMPGTVQGQSGWYQMVHQGQDLVIKFVIDAEGQWQKKDGPFVMSEWNRQRILDRRNVRMDDEDWQKERKGWRMHQLHSSTFARNEDEEAVEQLIGEG